MSPVREPEPVRAAPNRQPPPEPSTKPRVAYSVSLRNHRNSQTTERPSQPVPARPADALHMPRTDDQLSKAAAPYSNPFDPDQSFRVAFAFLLNKDFIRFATIRFP